MNRSSSFVRGDGPLLLFFLLGALLARVLYVMTQDVLFDDAYITYQFARNLVQGHGFSFNPEVVVYGSSSHLYAFLAAAIGFLWSTDVPPDVTEPRMTFHFSNHWFFDHNLRESPTFFVLRNSEFEWNEYMSGGYNDMRFTENENRWFQREYPQAYRNRGFSEGSDLVVHQRIRQ
jgi:hypothetical protein